MAGPHMRLTHMRLAHPWSPPQSIGVSRARRSNSPNQCLREGKYSKGSSASQLSDNDEGWTPPKKKEAPKANKKKKI